MIISVNRKIFNILSKDEDALYDYISGCVSSNYDEYNPEHEDIVVKDVAKNIIKVITSNEETISKIGLKKYFHNDMKADDYVSGYYYNSGKIVICPFDWSMQDENDEKFEYSFTLARMI